MYANFIIVVIEDEIVNEKQARSTKNIVAKEIKTPTKKDASKSPKKKSSTKKSATKTSNPANKIKSLKKEIEEANVGVQEEEKAEIKPVEVINETESQEEHQSILLEAKPVRTTRANTKPIKEKVSKSKEKSKDRGETRRSQSVKKGKKAKKV